jgi:hypothetical protein
MGKTKTSEDAPKGLVGTGPFDRVYRWKNNPKRKHLVGKPCRVLAHGTTMHSVLVEFEDGERVVTARRAVQRPKK